MFRALIFCCVLIFVSACRTAEIQPGIAPSAEPDSPGKKNQIAGNSKDSRDSTMEAFLALQTLSQGFLQKEGETPPADDLETDVRALARNIVATKPEAFREYVESPMMAELVRDRLREEWPSPEPRVETQARPQLQLSGPPTDKPRDKRLVSQHFGYTFLLVAGIISAVGTAAVTYSVYKGQNRFLCNFGRGQGIIALGLSAATVALVVAAYSKGELDKDLTNSIMALGISSGVFNIVRGFVAMGMFGPTRWLVDTRVVPPQKYLDLELNALVRDDLVRQINEPLPGINEPLPGKKLSSPLDNVPKWAGDLINKSKTGVMVTEANVNDAFMKYQTNTLGIHGDTKTARLIGQKIIDNSFQSLPPRQRMAIGYAEAPTFYKTTVASGAVAIGIGIAEAVAAATLPQLLLTEQDPIRDYLQSVDRIFLKLGRVVN